MKNGIDSRYSYHLIVIAVISLVCAAIYSNTLNSAFVFDDFVNIKKNPYVRLKSLDYQKLYDVGFKSRLPNRPVSNISFALNYYFGEYDVTGYRVVNIIIHLINGILVYFLSLIIFKQSSHVSHQRILHIQTDSIPFMSLFVSLIFITHPIQTQSVTYIVQRMNSMAAMFYLLSLLLYIKGRLSRIKWKQWGLFCGCFASWIMALGSKETAGTLPFIILIYEWYFFQNLQSDGFRQNIKYVFALFAILVFIVFIYLGKRPFDTILGSYTYRDFTLSERVLTQFRVVVFYISLLFFPHPSRLNLLHSFSISHSLFVPATTLLSLLFIVGLIGYAIFISKKQRLLSFIVLWFFINLIIESSVIGLEIIYEHRLYLPLFGFALLTAYLLFGLLSKKQHWAFFISVLIVLSLGAATYVRNRVWQDETTLWPDVISKNPKSHRAYNNFGTALNEQDRTGEAIEHFLQALRIRPDYGHAHYNLGNALDKLGRTGEAVEHYLQALRIRPDYEKAHNNLGNALDKLGRTDEAVEHYLQALRIRPDYENAHYNLGFAFAKQGRTEEAITHYLQVLRITPDHIDAHNNLGIALARLGRTDEAIKHFLQVLRVKPNDADAHFNIGLALAQRGRTDEAVEHYHQALRIKPDYENAHYNLGFALAKQGRTDEAITHYLHALQIKPDHVDVHNNLGVALYMQGRIDEAIEHYLHALRIKPDYIDAHYNLGLALFRKGNIEGAIACFREALKVKPDYVHAKNSLKKVLMMRQQNQ